MESALQKDVYLRDKKISLKETEALLNISGGDGRKLLNLLEMVAEAITGERSAMSTDELVMKVAQKRIALYDKSGSSIMISFLPLSNPSAAATPMRLCTGWRV